MKTMRTTVILLIFLSVTAAAAMAGGGTKGEKSDCAATINRRCEICHYKNRICEQLGRKNKKKWRATIKRMIRHGATVNKKEAESLAGCLAVLRPGADICRP